MDTNVGAAQTLSDMSCIGSLLHKCTIGVASAIMVVNQKVQILLAWETSVIHAELVFITNKSLLISLLAWKEGKSSFVNVFV